jgi:hypothetical protein
LFGLLTLENWGALLCLHQPVFETVPLGRQPTSWRLAISMALLPQLSL